MRPSYTLPLLPAPQAAYNTRYNRARRLLNPPGREDTVVHLAFTLNSYFRYTMRGRTHKLIYNNLLVPLRPFYRAYPYQGRVSIASADSRGCVDMELGFFCNRIPKAANSTVTTTLARVKTGHEVASRRAKKLFCSPAQLSADDVARVDQLFKFAIVRNPYSRTLSAYLDKVARDLSRSEKIRGFAHFIRSLEHGKLHSNAHWAPQSSLLLLPRNQFDYIGKSETLDRDLNTVLQHICPNDTPAIKSTLSNATGASKKLQTYYNDDLAARVLRLYRDDFNQFDFDPTFPSA